MDHPSKSRRFTDEQQLMAGIRKHFSKTESFVADGDKFTVPQILAALQARIDATNAVLPAKAAWRALVREERGTLDETHDLVLTLREYILFKHRSSLAMLADLGIEAKGELANGTNDDATASRPAPPANGAPTMTRES